MGNHFHTVCCISKGVLNPGFSEFPAEVEADWTNRWSPNKRPWPHSNQHNQHPVTNLGGNKQSFVTPSVEKKVEQNWWLWSVWCKHTRKLIQNVVFASGQLCEIEWDRVSSQTVHLPTQVGIKPTDDRLKSKSSQNSSFLFVYRSSWVFEWLNVGKWCRQCCTLMSRTSNANVTFPALLYLILSSKLWPHDRRFHLDHWSMHVAYCFPQGL